MDSQLGSTEAARVDGEAGGRGTANICLMQSSGCGIPSPPPPFLLSLKVNHLVKYYPSNLFYDCT